MATEDVDDAGKRIDDGLVGLTVLVPNPAPFTCSGGWGLLFIFSPLRDYLPGQQTTTGGHKNTVAQEERATMLRIRVFPD